MMKWSAKSWLAVGIASIPLVLGSIFLFFHHASLQLPTVPLVDFDFSMDIVHYPQRLKHPTERAWYNTCKKLYDRNRAAVHVRCGTTKIPKIIHQIWLGSPFPEKYRGFQASWQQQHPDWEYKLWTDAELATFPMKNRALYDAAKNYGEKSDIARYEILYTYGGLYVDTDFECLRSFDPLHNCYDFYVGIQPLDTNVVQLGIGLIGAAVAHPLLAWAIDLLPKNVEQYQQIIQRTGPLYFTRVFTEAAPQLKVGTVALPATYFYPKGYTQRDVPPAVWQRPESFAVHHWEGSWLKKEAFVPREE